MKASLVFTLTLAVACNAVDISNPPITPQEISEMIVPAVKAAQAPLNRMVDVEEAEVSEMNDIKQTVDKLEKSGPEPQQAAIQDATKRIELDENKAIANEDRQQKMALDSMNKAKQLIKGFHARGVGNNKELGESGKDQPMESALHHIETVEKALEKDTATSHTKEKASSPPWASRCVSARDSFAMRWADPAHAQAVCRCRAPGYCQQHASTRDDGCPWHAWS
jgi:hypothetical protein